jgi:hypothetical protein
LAILLNLTDVALIHEAL